MIVCLGRSGSAAPWVTQRAVEIVELGKQPGKDPRIILKLAQLFRNRGVQVAHSHNWATLAETAAAARLSPGTRHLHAQHGQQHEEASLPTHRRVARGLLRARLLAGIPCVVVSESLRRFVAEEWRLRGAIHVIPNGVETMPRSEDARQRLRAELGIRAGSHVVGSVGRLSAVKDFGTAVRAVALLAQEGRDVHLVLVGDGDRRQQLGELRQQVGLDSRVHLVGRQDAVADWLSVMDVYVNSSVSEALSMSILEAMSMGLPIVATDVGDNRLLVDGPPPCGRVVGVGDAAGMSAALAATLDGPKEKWGAAGRERFLSGYTIERMTQRYADLYLAMAGRP